MKRKQHSERKDKDNPALKGVEETFALGRVPIVDQESSADHTQAVGDDCDRDRGDQQNQSRKGFRFEEITVDDRKRRQRQKRADPAASLSYLKRHRRKLNDVAFPKDGNAKKAKQRAGNLRGHKLQRKRYLIEDDCGERDHKEKKCPWERETLEI